MKTKLAVLSFGLACAGLAFAQDVTETKKARFTAVGVEGTCTTISNTSGRVRATWKFPQMNGVIMCDSLVVDPKAWVPPADAKTGRRYGYDLSRARFLMKDAESFPLSSCHQRIIAYHLQDMTDIRSELVQEDEWVLMPNEAPLIISAPVLVAEDTRTGQGVCFMRIAPLPHIRPVEIPDFVVCALDNKWKYAPTIAAVPNGYPVARVTYTGGRLGRIAALRSIERVLRPYKPGRDGIFLSNTWGDSNRDARINANFIMAEVKAGGELGVDVIQIDDGWQKGKSQNSAMITNRAQGAWGDFRKHDPQFWQPDPIRFPQGLAPLVKAAKARGMGFGLWYGPDSTDDCAAWRKDADTLLAFYHELGIRYFKIDSLRMNTPTSLANQLKMFNAMLTESNGEMTFDLDVTGATRRPGYFGIPEIGPLFVENRYWKNGRYWPHSTLRNLWSLSQVIDPVRLRMEVLNPLHGLDQYPESPLSPSKYRADTLFAITMVSSPLGWFEISELAPKTVAEMKPLIATWKRERTQLHGGLTIPVGGKPDGVSWTGFITRSANNKNVYALLFRELNEQSSFTLTSPFFQNFTTAETLGGRGVATVENGLLTVRIPEKLDFIWVKLHHHPYVLPRSFGPLSPSAKPYERTYIWPEGKMPAIQAHQIAAKTAEKSAPDFKPENFKHPYIDWYKPNATNKTDLCVVTISGGGFGCCCDAARLQPAIDRLVRAGITVADITYRTPRPKGLPVHQSAWIDAQRAIRVIRSQAAQRGFDPKKIGGTGISAGAKTLLLLATSSMTNAYAPIDEIDKLPCNLLFAIPQAPAYVLTDGNGTPNTRGGEGADITLVPELAFDAQTCPMCFFQGGTDEYSPLGTTRLYRKLRTMGIPAEVHLFADRWHGFHGDMNRGDEGTAWDHWFTRAEEFIRQMNYDGRLASEVDIWDNYTNDLVKASYEKEAIWPAGKMPSAQTNQCLPYLEWHIPPTLKTRAIQIIYSGGGYWHGGPIHFEVAPMRRYLNAMGMAVVTVNYRTPRPLGGLPKHITAWQDIQRAIRIVRAKASQKGLDPNLIGIMGSSAGGHLTLLCATGSKSQTYAPIDEFDRLSCAVQWAVAIYPAYILTDGLDGINKNGGNGDQDRLSPELPFDLATCPVLFLHGDADKVAAMGSVKCWEQMRRMGIQSEVHTFATRNHCFMKKAAPGTGSYTWMGRVWEFLNHKGFNR